MTPRDKARLLGLFFWLFTLFNIFIVAVIAIIYIALFGFVISAAPQKAGDPPPELIMTILIVIFVFAFVFVILFSIPKIVAGYGLRNDKSWARIWAIIASIMACMSFPFGTAIGIFGLVFLFSEDGKHYFDNPQYGRLPGIANPPPNSWQ
ncbi:MAG: hypothetical protein ACKVRN_14085 [Pyrinomonadaceae bacterium]